ncbi:hypothetical protein CARUB_v10010822mg [Capsella rubella]|uniref:Uncharacterized protein n=1 Tax=Capsella rubella TaxID=81985 RepID=R0GS02_9BRAS|nr:hypothetical protein CARUB_v10010822mg [Capsella rubella]
MAKSTTTPNQTRSSQNRDKNQQLKTGDKETLPWQQRGAPTTEEGKQSENVGSRRLGRTHRRERLLSTC